MLINTLLGEFLSMSYFKCQLKHTLKNGISNSIILDYFESYGTSTTVHVFKRRLQMIA